MKGVFLRPTVATENAQPLGELALIMGEKDNEGSDSEPPAPIIEVEVAAGDRYAVVAATFDGDECDAYPLRRTVRAHGANAVSEDQFSKALPKPL